MSADTNRLDAESVFRKYLALDYTDAAARAALFAPNAVLEDPVGMPKIIGRTAIEQKFRETIDMGFRSSTELLTFAEVGREIVAGLQATVLRDGVLFMKAPIFMLIEIGAEGLVESLRVFIARESGCLS